VFFFLFFSSLLYIAIGIFAVCLPQKLFFMFLFYVIGFGSFFLFFLPVPCYPFVFRFRWLHLFFRECFMCLLYYSYFLFSSLFFLLLPHPHFSDFFFLIFRFSFCFAIPVSLLRFRILVFCSFP